MAKAPKKPMTQTEVINTIAEDTELTRADIKAVFESLENVIRNQLGRSGPGSFGLGGLFKIEVKKVAARKAKKGVPNPC